MLLVYSSTQAQVLKTTNLNLNTGGKIHDVAYDAYYDAYIVVGNFTSIGGQARNNLAFIDASTLNVLPYNPITAIDGEIRTIELYATLPLFISFPADPNNPDGHRRYMYLGGNFSTINGVSLPYLARLSASHYYANPPLGGTAPYLVNPTWSINGTYVAGFAELGVYDLHLDADTLVIAGKFYSQKPYYPSGQRNFLTAFDVTSNVNDGWLNIFPSTVVAHYNDYPVYTVDKFENEYYMTVFDEVFRYNSQGVNSTPNYGYNYTYSSSTPSVRHIGFNVSSFGDTVMYSAYHRHANGYAIEMDSIGQQNIPTPTITTWDAFDLELYKDYIFSCHSGTTTNQLITKKLNASFALSTSSTFNLNNNWQPLNINSYTPDRQYESLFQRNNLLFVSGSNLSTIDGSSRTGLAVFCLEPSPAEPFTTFDPTACEGDSSTYSIPQAQCADGYRWTYTGSGALYRISGSSNPWTALSSTNLFGTNATSIDVYFPLGSTGGTLSVEPFTLFSTSEYHYSQAQSMNITVNAIPDIILASTHTLNCYSDTVLMVAQSTMSNVNFDWVFNNGGSTVNNDTIIITQNNTNAYDSSYYFVTLTNILTGCVNSDSTYFTTDLVADPISQSAITTNPLEWNCLTDSMTINSNITAATVTWENPSQTGTFADPYVITSVPSGNLTVYATYLSNGCQAQADFGGIIVNTVSANPVLVGHPNYLTELIDDSLSCLNPSLTLQCDVEAAYSAVATAQWSYNGTPLGTNILNLSTADSLGMDASNLKFYTIVTTHSASQCLDSTNIIVRFDYDKPFVSNLADGSINCSQNQITLTHSLNGNQNVIEGWIDATNSQTGVDTIGASTIGDYYYQVFDTQNGCVNADTVAVTQSLELLLDMPSDTLVCPDEIVLISPSVIGNAQTPSFVWSTGSTSTTESATGGVDSQLSVTVTTPSGCSGTDTTTISITAPVQAVITPIAGCTDGNLEVTSISGGAGNYQYALDGSTWQISTTFGGLTFDDYTISVLDDLGCVYDFNQTLDGTASSVEIQFAASTYNEEGDTIVLVNITDFTGLDSIAWVFPSIADVYYQSDSTVILSIATGGWYDVDLIGYLGATCVYSYTKSVYFGTEAPVFDENQTSKGIQSFVISPNPTTGAFDVDFEFGEAQNYTILVTNSLGQPMVGMSVSAVGTIVSHSFNFPVGTPAGSYRIHVIADYDAQQKMLILN